MASIGTDPLLGELLKRAADLLAGWRGQLIADAQTPLDTVVAGVRTAIPTPSRNAHRRSVCRLLPDLLAAAARLDRALAVNLDALADTLHWTQTYDSGPVSESFFDNYGHAALVSPAGPALHASVKLGVLMLGPRQLYPDHAHPAGEFYAILAGEPDWRIGTGHWHRRQPGDLIHHPPEVAHATQTRDSGLLALYAWYGAIDAPPRFV